MSGFHDPLENQSSTNEDVDWFSRDLPDIDDLSAIAINEVNAWRETRGLPPLGKKGSRYTDEEIAKHREEWLANKKPEQPKKDEQPMEENKPLTERTYNFKTVAIVAVVAFVLGWSAFWLFGNRSGRFQTVKWGSAAFILDTRTGEVSHLNGEKVTRKF